MSLISNRLWSGHYEEAKRYWRQQKPLRSGEDSYNRLWAAYVAQGSTQVARQRYAPKIEADPEGWLVGKFFGYSLVGRRDSAREVARRLLPRVEKTSALGAGLLAHLGRVDEAAALLPKVGSAPPVSIKVHPVYDPLRDHPTYQKIIREMGLDEASIEKTIEKLDPSPPEIPDQPAKRASAPGLSS